MIQVGHFMRIDFPSPQVVSTRLRMPREQSHRPVSPTTSSGVLAGFADLILRRRSLKVSPFSFSRQVDSSQTESPTLPRSPRSSSANRRKSSAPACASRVAMSMALAPLSPPPVDDGSLSAPSSTRSSPRPPPTYDDVIFNSELIP